MPPLPRSVLGVRDHALFLLLVFILHSSAQRLPDGRAVLPDGDAFFADPPHEDVASIARAYLDALLISTPISTPAPRRPTLNITKATLNTLREQSEDIKGLEQALLGTGGTGGTGGAGTRWLENAPAPPPKCDNACVEQMTRREVRHQLKDREQGAQEEHMKTFKRSVRKLRKAQLYGADVFPPDDTTDYVSQIGNAAWGDMTPVLSPGEKTGDVLSSSHGEGSHAVPRGGEFESDLESVVDTKDAKVALTDAKQASVKELTATLKEAEKAAEKAATKLAVRPLAEAMKESMQKLFMVAPAADSGTSSGKEESEAAVRQQLKQAETTAEKDTQAADRTAIAEAEAQKQKALEEVAGVGQHGATPIQVTAAVVKVDAKAAPPKTQDLAAVRVAQGGGGDERAARIHAQNVAHGIVQDAAARDAEATRGYL